MALEIKSDLENVNWEQLAYAYATAFKGIQTAELIETVFRRSYATRIAVLDGIAVGGIYAFSDGVLDATVHGLCVHPDRQKDGIGRALLESLLEEFGPHIAVILTTESQLQHFYRGAGFRPLKTAMGRGFPANQLGD